jgi:hypothetical protein
MGSSKEDTVLYSNPHNTVSEKVNNKCIKSINKYLYLENSRVMTLQRRY